jgi:hypothetical protein
VNVRRRVNKSDEQCKQQEDTNSLGRKKIPSRVGLPCEPLLFGPCSLVVALSGVVLCIRSHRDVLRFGRDQPEIEAT